MAKPVDDPATTHVDDPQVTIEGEYIGPRPAEHVPGDGRFRRLKERKIPGTKGTK